MFRYKFWIHKKDSKGRPLDEKIVKAAEEIAPTLARYRQHEIRCESAANALLQSAVEAASNAKRAKPLDNPIGYLSFIHKRIVDRFLKGKKKLVAVDDAFLADLVNARETVSFEEQIHNRLLLQKLINCMDTETRQISDLISEGYSMTEIAKQMHISLNCLSKRWSRGVEKAIKKAFEGNGESQIDDARQAI